MNDIYTGSSNPAPQATGQSQDGPDLPTHTVRSGENFWVIAQNTLREAYGREPTNAEVQAYWQQLMAANADRLEHPGNFDLIYPDQEFVLPDIPPPGGGDAEEVTGGDGGPDGTGGSGGPASSAEARAETDAQLARLEELENSDWGTELEFDRQNSLQSVRQDVFDAIEAEIETELREWLQENPDASARQIEAKADEIRSGIQARSETAARFDDASMAFRTQQAVNTVSAEQHGYNLDNVAPGTRIQDGPYSEQHGPFEPGSTIRATDGSEYRVDDTGHIADGPVAAGEDDDGNVTYEVYAGGVATGQSWTVAPEPSRPAAGAEPPESDPVAYVPDEPATNRQRTDAAASGYYAHAVDGSPEAEQARQDLVLAIRAELATGGDLAEIQERYGDDPFFNEVIHEAAYG